VCVSLSLIWKYVHVYVSLSSVCVSLSCVCRHLKVSIKNNRRISRFCPAIRKIMRLDKVCVCLSLCCVCVSLLCVCISLSLRVRHLQVSIKNNLRISRFCPAIRKIMRLDNVCVCVCRHLNVSIKNNLRISRFCPAIRNIMRLDKVCVSLPCVCTCMCVYLSVSLCVVTSRCLSRTTLGSVASALPSERS